MLYSHLVFRLLRTILIFVLFYQAHQQIIWAEAFFSNISSGTNHTCGISSGDGYCWGSNNSQQLGIRNADADASEPTKVWVHPVLMGPSIFQWIAAGRNHTCAQIYLENTGIDQTYCWGSGTDGQLGDGYNLSQPHPFTPIQLPFISEKFVSVSLGSKHSCGVTNYHRVYCWGDDSYGQLGNDEALEDHSTPVLAALPAQGETYEYIAVALGFNHSCALDTYGMVYCWGSDFYGQLGNNTELINSPLPQLIDQNSIEETFVTSLTAGDNHTCIASADGRAFCWGYDISGQLGNDNPIVNQNQPIPNLVIGVPSLVSISAGGNHTCGETVSGEGYCWGSGGSGQIGNGTNINRSLPAVINPDSIIGGIQTSTLSPKGNHTCGISNNGLAYCWGSDVAGELGDSAKLESSNLPVPVNIPDLENHAPTIIVRPSTNLEVQEGREIRFHAIIFDQDLDDVTVSINGSPVGAYWNETTSAFNWTPGYNQSGIYHIRIHATDGVDPAETVVTIRVINQRPHLQTH